MRWIKGLEKTIYSAYLDWASTHTPTWETDNLIGDMLNWPKWYKGLYKPKEVNNEDFS